MQCSLNSDWGGVKATVVTGTNGANGPVGTLPSGISNLQYEDYSLFVGTKNITISWSGSADGYLVYYLAEEGEPSWYQQRVYWYTKNYAYSEYDSYENGIKDYFRRIVHLDQGPTAKEGNTYNTFYDNGPDQNDLSTDPTESDMGIGWVPSMNPFLVGRSVKWDDPTCWDNDENKPVIQRVPLSQGSLTIPDVSKSTIVFFNFVDAAGNYYAGPDKLTNSQAAANRHSPLSLLPWNQCYISAHLNVPMPLKILWSTEENGTYTEVSAGTDVTFPTTAYVKFQWNDDFITAVQSSQSDFLSSGTSNYDVYYTTTSLLPLKQRPGTKQFEADYEGTESYDPDRLEAVKYDVSQDTAIVVSANTVLRFAIYPSGSTTMYLGQDDNGGNINDVLDETGENLQNEGNQLLKYYEQNKYSNDYGVNTYNAVSLYGASDSWDQGEQLGPIPPINTFLRNNYLWGITFIKQATANNPKAVTFSRPIPYTSWSENVGGRYGLGSGTYSYQTWVSDGDYLVPSSLEGICDFFIVVQPETYWDQSVGVRDNGIYLSRINWIPKNMPVIVRYRNYSTPKPLPSAVQTAIDNNNAAAEAELANGLYFHGGGNCANYADDEGNNSFYDAHYNSKVLKPVYSGDYDGSNYSGLPEYMTYYPVSDLPSTWQFDEYGHYNNGTFRWSDPITDGSNPLYLYTEPDGYGGYSVRYKLYDKTDNTDGSEISSPEDYLPLYFVWNSTEGVPCTQKTSDGNELLYHKVDAAGNKLYYSYYATDGNDNPLYYYYDNGNLAYQEVDGSGNRLYIMDGIVSDGNGNYQKMDTAGNLLYYVYQYRGSWTQLYVVKGEKTDGSVVQITSHVDSSTADGVVSSNKGFQGYTNNVWKEPMEGTLSDLQSLNTSLPEGETIPQYPVWTTEMPTTTVPNEHPYLTTANTDYPAYTTEDTGTRALSDVATDDYVETTTVTNFPVETTYRDNKNDYEYEEGYVYTKCDPLIDEGQTNGDEPHAYTLTNTGHPAYTLEQTSGSYDLQNGDGSSYLDPYYNRDWLAASMWKTTEASHEDDSSGERVYHAPLYDSSSGAEAKVWDFGGNYFTNIRELSNTMLTGSSSANYDFNFEDHTFYLYAGDPTHCQYNKDWMMYHLSTRQNRDEANFINVLQFSDTPISVDGSSTYYGFSIDHKNEFHPANTSAWATEYSNGSLDSSKDYIFSAGADQYNGSGALNVSLQSYSFMQRYNSLCESTDANGSSVFYQPVVDNWLVFAPNGGDANTELTNRTYYYTMPYYYGYGPTDLMRKQTTIGSGEMDTPYDEVSDSYKESDSFGGWTSAAWKRVSSGTIAARRPYLQLYNGSTFYDPDKVPDRNGSLNQENSAKYNIFAGGGLSLREAFIEDDGTTTGLKYQPAAATADGAVYDLQGRRIADNPSALSSGSIAKGVYIVNGKKQVVR